MCAIIGSFNKEILIELIELNSYRGQHSYSFTVFNPVKKEISVIQKGLGKFDYSVINIPAGCYGVAHIQAPTTESTSIESIHPALQNDFLLWHNGILKETTVKRLAQKWHGVSWDTKLLLLELNGTQWDTLNKIDGTFSCLYYSYNELFLFRNKISPMFIDSELNLSSTKFNNSKETVADKVFAIDFNNKRLNEVAAFTTADNPYYFGDEI